VLMTVLGDELDDQRLRQSGFAAQVSKPIWKSSLRDCLQRVLDDKPKLEATVASAVTAASPEPEPQQTQPARQLRVLVAEDNPTNQEVSLAILHKLGYETELAANGELAIRALQAQDFDLVLMDCEMPTMDGYEATKRIRAGQDGVRNRDIPIVALTASAMSADRDRCFRAGMSDYISKPVDPQQLATILARWTAPSKAATAKPQASLPVATGIPVFDETELLERLMGDRKLARRLVDSFVHDVPAKLANLDDLVHAADSASIRAVAHALKGAAANLSARALKELAMQLQQAATVNDLQRCAVLVSSMQTDFKRLQAALVQSEWGR